MENNREKNPDTTTSTSQDQLKKLLWLVPIAVICTVLFISVALGLTLWRTMSDRDVSDDVVRIDQDQQADEGSITVGPNLSDSASTDPGSEASSQADAADPSAAEATSPTQVEQAEPGSVLAESDIFGPTVIDPSSAC